MTNWEEPQQDIDESTFTIVKSTDAPIGDSFSDIVPDPVKLQIS
jgi:hypothetical protein